MSPRLDAFRNAVVRFDQSLIRIGKIYIQNITIKAKRSKILPQIGYLLGNQTVMNSTIQNVVDALRPYIRNSTIRKIRRKLKRNRPRVPNFNYKLRGTVFAGGNRNVTKVFQALDAMDAEVARKTDIIDDVKQFFNQFSATSVEEGEMRAIESKISNSNEIVTKYESLKFAGLRGSYFDAYEYYRETKDQWDPIYVYKEPNMDEIKTGIEFELQFLQNVTRHLF